MVKIIPLLALTALAACDTAKFREPIALTPHGTAVRANMAAQIINPEPSAQGPVLGDGARALIAVDAYRRGETEAPSQVQTQDSVSAAISQ